MKRIFTLSFILSFLIILPSFSQVLFEENFDNGAVDNSDITVVNSDWIRHSGTQGPSYSADGLSFSGYSHSGVGGAVSFTNGASGNNDGDVNRSGADSVSANGDIYLSFLVNLASARTGDYFIHVGPKTIGTTFRLRVFAKDTVSGGWKIGLSKSSEAAQYSDEVLSYSKTYLIIAKYTFSDAANNDDVVTLYLYENETPSTEPGSPLITLGPLGTGTSGDPTDIGSVAIRQGGNTPTGKVDGIKLALTWSEIVPVELTSFKADISGNKVTLNWATATEKNNSGFEVERKAAGGNYEKIAFVAGNGTTTESRVYSYIDTDIKSGKYFYRLKQVDFDGSFTYSHEVEVDAAVPAQYSLEQNYPNPFNPATTINFNLPVDAKVKLRIYDILGEEIHNVVDNNLAAGNYSFDVNFAAEASGVYFYRLEASGADGSSFTSMMKMILNK